MRRLTQKRKLGRWGRYDDDDDDDDEDDEGDSGSDEPRGSSSYIDYPHPSYGSFGVTL